MNETVHLAFEALGEVAADEALQAHDYEYGMTLLEGLFAELPSHGLSFSFTIDAIPVAYRKPLANLLACDIEGAGRAGSAPYPRATALIRLRAVQNRYVRDMDLDDNGTTTEAETCAFDRGAYF